MTFKTCIAKLKILEVNKLSYLLFLVKKRGKAISRLKLGNKIIKKSKYSERKKYKRNKLIE